MKNSTMAKIIGATGLALSSLSFAHANSNTYNAQIVVEMNIIDSSVPVEAMVNYRGIIKSDGMEIRHGEIVLVAYDESNSAANVLANKIAYK